MNSLGFKKIIYVNIILFLNTVLFYYLNKINIDLFIFSKYIPGWDGSTHYSMALLYSQSIFPSVWGWIPNYFFGMPFPQFYPPLFSYIFSLVNLFVNNSTLVYKGIILVSVFIQPILFFFFYYKLYKKFFESVIVLFLTTLLISISDPRNSITNSFFGAINTGVVSQIITSIFFYLFVYYLGKSNTISNICIRIILLVIIFLGSVHLSVLAFILFVSAFLYDFLIVKEKHLFKIYIITGLISLGIASFWIIPMLSFYNFSTGLPLRLGFFDLEFYSANKWFLLIPIFGVFHSILKIKNKFIFTISFSTIFIFIIDEFHKIVLLKYIPLHLDRYIAMLSQYIPLVFVYLISLSIHNNKIKRIIYISASVFLFLNIIFSSNPLFSRGINPPSLNNFIDSIVFSVDDLPKKSRILMEYYTFVDAPLSRIINDYSGMNSDMQMVVTIFRESSLSSIFNVPVRNLFSKNGEHWGIRSNLAANEIYLNKDFYKKIIDIKILGIEYVYIKSNEILNKLEGNNSFQFIEKNGGINIFKVKYEDYFDTPNYTILEYKPILIVSEIDTKHFNNNRLDFITLSEEIISLSENQIHFVYTNINNLEDIVLEDFSFVVFDKVILEENKEIILKYIEDNPSSKFFIPDTVTGFEKNNNILNYIDMMKYNFNQAYFKYTFDSFKKYLVKVKQPKNLSYEHIENSFLFLNKEKYPAYIIIKNSYYPSWVSINGQRVYHASPNFMFIKLEANSSNTIYFSTPLIVLWAHYISLFSLSIFGLSVILLSLKYKINKTT